MRLLFVFAAMMLTAACASFPDAPAPVQPPAIDGDAVISVDGARLGLTAWRAADPGAAIVGVHGMNDYAGAFALAGPFWAERGVSVYAYDQRGFGRSPNPGRWAGADAMKQDLRAVIAATRADNPGLPVYVVGHSMGAAVILAALKDAPLDVDGIILAAPGIWGGASMSILYRTSLYLAAVVAPGKTLTGERAARQASDNIEFLRAMFADPLVIKETRIDSILGVERLMGEAYDATDEVADDILLVYGEKDDIIPIKQLEKAARRLCATTITMRYAQSWHMIFADLERAAPLADMLDWIAADRAGDKKWRPQHRMGNPVTAVSNCEGPSG